MRPETTRPDPDLSPCPSGPPEPVVRAVELAAWVLKAEPGPMREECADILTALLWALDDVGAWVLPRC